MKSKKHVIIAGGGASGMVAAISARRLGADVTILEKNPRVGKKILATGNGRCNFTNMNTDISNYRLQKERECGIDSTLNVSETSAEEGIKSCFGEEGFQVGFEAAGVQGSLDFLIANVEKGGDVIILGVYAKNPEINMYYVGEHELNLFGSMMYRHEDYEEAVSMIAEGKINTEPLISKHFPFNEYLHAYEYIEHQKDKTMKVIIDFN